jgi:predicted RNase H-like nuclease (RuvC/YqgF family)
MHLEGLNGDLEKEIPHRSRRMAELESELRESASSYSRLKSRLKTISKKPTETMDRQSENEIRELMQES